MHGEIDSFRAMHREDLQAVRDIFHWAIVSLTYLQSGYTSYLRTHRSIRVGGSVWSVDPSTERGMLFGLRFASLRVNSRKTKVHYRSGILL